MQYKGATKLYECESGAVYSFPVNHCVFCRHCTDLFYDYTNGPYMFTCDLDLQPCMTEFTCTCDKFDDDGYVFDLEEYKARIEARNKAAEEFRKISEENIKYIERFVNKYFFGELEKESED